MLDTALDTGETEPLLEVNNIEVIYNHVMLRIDSGIQLTADWFGSVIALANVGFRMVSRPG